MRIGWFAVSSTLILNVVVAAQEPNARIDYGKTEELEGVTKVFVTVKADKSRRDEIARYIEKELQGVTVTERSEDAEVLLAYDAGHYAGAGLIYKIVGNNRIRVLMNWQGSKGRILGRDLEKKFAEAFVAAYRGANRIRKDSLTAESNSIDQRPMPKTESSGTWHFVLDMDGLHSSTTQQPYCVHQRVSLRFGSSKCSNQIAGSRTPTT